MTQRKSYGAYRESGIKWLGRIPENWSIHRVKSTIEFSQNGVWGEDPDGGSDDIECARVADFDRVSFTVSDNLATYRKVPEAQRRSREVKDGDLLFEKSGGGEKTLVGAIVQYKGSKAIICSNFVSVIKVKSGVNSRWLCYANAFLYSIGVNSRSIKQATGIQNIDSEQYFSERIPVPSKLEQDRIAIWLDRETARIDTLIAKKTRFIELLKEKRQAVIAKAVTKGLDDSVDMKDSGIDWLGAVPSHWQLKRLRFEVSINPSAKELGYVAEGTPTAFFPMEAIGEDGEIDRSRRRPFSELQSGYSYFRNGDVVVAKVTPCFENGKGAVISGIYDGFGFGTTELVTIRPSSKILSSFLYFITKSYPVRKLGVQSMSGASGLKRVPDEFFRNLAWPIPPVHEQKVIVDYLQLQLARLDNLMLKTERSIELLKEHRAALITAAVTGKIDVREAA